MVLIIDNYDSFTYNLVHYLIELGADVHVYKNDQISVDECVQLKPSHVVISPGPCTPDQSGISIPLIKRLHQTTPILGVCLGHQAIAQAFGAKITTARRIMHGKLSRISHTNKGIFNGLPTEYNVTRYHSLIVEQNTLAPEFSITATTCDQGQAPEIMAIAHQHFPLFGVQFHPEAILSECGRELLNNFLAARASSC